MRSTVFPAAGAIVRSGSLGNFSASAIVPPRGDAEPYMILAMFDQAGQARTVGDVLAASPSAVVVKQDWTTFDDQQVVEEDYVEATTFPGFSGIEAVREYLAQQEERLGSNTVWGSKGNQIYRLWLDGSAWGYVIGAMSGGPDPSDLGRWNALVDLLDLAVTATNTTKVVATTPIAFSPRYVRDAALSTVIPQWTRISGIGVFVPYSNSSSHTDPNSMRTISGGLATTTWFGLQILFKVMHNVAKHEANNWFDSNHEPENWHTAQQNLLRYGWQIVSRADEATPAPLNAMWPMTCDPDVYASWDDDTRNRCIAEAKRLGHQYRSHAAIAEVLSATSALLETSSAQSATSLQAAVAGVTEANARLQSVVSAIGVATEGITTTSATATSISTTLERVNEISNDIKNATGAVRTVVEAMATLVDASRMDLATDTATLAEVKQISSQTAQAVALISQDLRTDLAQLSALAALVAQTGSELGGAIASLQLTAGSESMSAQLQSLRATLMNLGRPIYNVEKGAEPDELV